LDSKVSDITDGRCIHEVYSNINYFVVNKLQRISQHLK